MIRATKLSSRKSWRGRRAGASFAEFVFVLAVLLLIASIAFTSVEFVRRWQRLVMARGDLISITTAVRSFHARFNLWPGRTSTAGDQHYGTRKQSNADIMNVLRAVDGPGNPGHAANTNHIVFLDVAPAAPGLSGLNKSGEFLDPWGTPYQIILDLDYDNVCNVTDTIYQRIQGEGLIAWSCGPDKKTDTEDDLRSWRWFLPRKMAIPGGG